MMPEFSPALTELSGKGAAFWRAAGPVPVSAERVSCRSPARLADMGGAHRKLEPEGMLDAKRCYIDDRSGAGT